MSSDTGIQSIETDRYTIKQNTPLEMGKSWRFEVVACNPENEAQAARFMIEAQPESESASELYLRAFKNGGIIAAEALAHLLQHHPAQCRLITCGSEEARPKGISLYKFTAAYRFLAGETGMREASGGAAKFVLPHPDPERACVIDLLRNTPRIVICASHQSSTVALIATDSGGGALEDVRLLLRDKSNWAEKNALLVPARKNSELDAAGLTKIALNFAESGPVVLQPFFSIPAVEPSSSLVLPQLNTVTDQCAESDCSRRPEEFDELSPESVMEEFLFFPVKMLGDQLEILSWQRLEKDGLIWLRKGPETYDLVVTCRSGSSRDLGAISFPREASAPAYDSMLECELQDLIERLANTNSRNDALVNLKSLITSFEGVPSIIYGKNNFLVFAELSGALERYYSDPDLDFEVKVYQYAEEAFVSILNRRRSIEIFVPHRQPTKFYRLIITIDDDGNGEMTATTPFAGKVHVQLISSGSDVSERIDRHSEAIRRFLYRPDSLSRYLDDTYTNLSYQQYPSSREPQAAAAYEHAARQIVEDTFNRSLHPGFKPKGYALSVNEDGTVSLRISSGKPGPTIEILYDEKGPLRALVNDTPSLNPWRRWFRPSRYLFLREDWPREIKAGDLTLLAWEKRLPDWFSRGEKIKNGRIHQIRSFHANEHLMNPTFRPDRSTK